MVDNYMETAQERFLHDRELKKRQDEEMKQKVELKRQSALSQEEPQDFAMECINKECHGKGTARTSYLCEECFKQQRQEEEVGRNVAGQVAPMAKQEDLAESKVDITSIGIPRQNTLIDVGKSKFYTYYDESQCLPKENNLCDKDEVDQLIKQATNPINNTTSASAEPNNLRSLMRHPKGKGQGTSQGHSGAAVELARSSFYDESLSNAHVSMTYARPVPEGTAFVNNLHNEYKENGSYSKQDQYNKPVPLAKQYTNEMFVQSQNLSPTRRKAFKLRESDGEMAGSGDYQAQLNEVIGDMKTETKQVNSKNEFTSTNTAQNNLQKQCREPGCRYFGTIATDFFCSACFKQKQKATVYKIHKSVNI